MIRKVRRMLAGIRWDAGDVAEFLGCHLTEPKAHVVFPRPLAPARAAPLRRRGVRGAACGSLSRPGCCFAAARIFMNGEASATDRRTARALTAPRRPARTCARIPGRRRDVMDQLYEWYRAGYIVLQ